MYDEDGGHHHVTIGRAYDANGKQVKSQFELDKAKAIKLGDEHTYKIVQDDDIKSGRYIRLTSDTYNKLFSKATDIEYVEKPLRVIVSYDVKRWFGKPKTKTETKTYTVYAVTRGYGNQAYPDGGERDPFLSTIRASKQFFKALKGKKTEDGLVRLKFEVADRNFFLGAIFRHPNQDINLGWAFFWISLVVGLVMFGLGLVSEAYDWKNGVRHFLAPLFG